MGYLGSIYLKETSKGLTKLWNIMIVSHLISQKWDLTRCSAKGKKNKKKKEKKKKQESELASPGPIQSGQDLDSGSGFSQ